MSSASELFPKGTRIGNWIIEDPLPVGGGCSYVYHAKSLTTEGKFVFKYILPKEGMELVEQEVYMNQCLHGCPNAVIGFDFISLEESVGYFMDYYEGGDLLDFLCRNESGITEDCVRHMARRILEALVHMHSSGFVHRDIKPENILLFGDGSVPDTYLADFGFCTQLPEDGQLIEQVGTNYYKAPELLCGASYGKEVDMWAFGVTFYAMITSRMPFPKPKSHWPEFLAAVQHGNYFTKELAGLSDDACDLIAALFKINPEERITAQEALAHPFFREPETDK